MGSRRSIAAVTTLTTVFALFGFTASVTAQVVNPSFEDDALGTSGNQFFFGDPVGWTTTGNAGPQRYNGTFAPAATDGNQHAFVNGGGTMSQLLSDIIMDGETYTLTVDVGQASAFSGSTGSIQLFGSTAGLGTPLINTNGTADLAGISPASGTYLTDQEVSYTALETGDPFAGQQIGIGLLGESGTQVIFDNVRFDITSAPSSMPDPSPGAVPEPSSIAIWSAIALGLAGLGYYRVRRTK